MESNLHVVMLPWPAFGHMMPFFQFSIALVKAGVSVSVVSTPRNIQRLPKLPPNLANLINLVELPFPILLDDKNQLPEGAEATVDIPFEKIQYLKIAHDLLKQPFKQYVAENSPDWIIVDFSPHWANEIAREYQIPIIFFSVFSAATVAFVGPPEYLVGDGFRKARSSPESLTYPPEWVSFPSSVAFQGYEASGFYEVLYGQNASGITDGERFGKALLSGQAIAVRSCSEFEGEYLNLVETINGKRVIPVGLLPPEKPLGRVGIKDESWSEIFKWLDEQKPKSVVFVGFGSECKLSKDQVYEIAYGLELSELPFLWALRKPNWATKDLDALPPGFGLRTYGKGVVSVGWAPQLEILAHPSIGGSLFHSGWGSAIETLQYGHCLIVLAFIIDQGLNARLLVEKGLAVEVDRKEDGSFSRDDISKSLKLAMVAEEGEQLRVGAREAAAIFGDQKLHQDYIGRFVQYLTNEAKKPVRVAPPDKYIHQVDIKDLEDSANSKEGMSSNQKDPTNSAYSDFILFPSEDHI